MYFVDVQGTLIDDRAQAPIPGAVDFIDALNRNHIPYLVVTNNTKRASSAFLAYLQSLGFAIPQNRYLDALMLLEREVPKKGVAAYGSETFLAQLDAMGYERDYIAPQTLLLSVRADYGAEDFAQMITFLMNGARLVGMHDTSLYATQERRYPGVGALLRMLSYAAAVPFTVVGKPSEAFYAEALRLLRRQCPEAGFERVTMISDDYAGDLTGAAGLGMRTALVLSGKVRPEDALAARLRREESGTVVYNDVTDIPSGKSVK
ncbi:HAD-IIA family hydrolase [Sulfurimonas sp. HSL-1656]|uniref:HAD-IIA family hydrolase n=1 Tax=Thiomicrolovo subterrani TaxID=3131934 RepID=UPI0031FA2ACA